MADNDQRLTRSLNGTNTKQNSGIYHPVSKFCVKVVSVSRRSFSTQIVEHSLSFTVHMLSTLSGFYASM